MGNIVSLIAHLMRLRDGHATIQTTRVECSSCFEIQTTNCYEIKNGGETLFLDDLIIFIIYIRVHWVTKVVFSRGLIAKTITAKVLSSRKRREIKNRVGESQPFREQTSSVQDKVRHGR
jgi:hypothetical protein